MAKTSELLDAHALRTRLERLQRTLETARQLSAILQPEELLKALVLAAAELTDSEQAAVVRVDAASGQLQFVKAPWLARERMQAATFGEDSPIHQAYRSLWPALGEEQPGLQVRNILAVPMVVEGSALGVLCAVNKRADAFDRNDILVMEYLAAQAAICIENADMLEQARQGYTTLAELDKMRNDFIAITSHELRIPLGLVLGHASFLSDILDGEAKQQSETIEKAALRLKDIVEDLSKIELAQSGTSVMRAVRYDLVEQLQRLVQAHQPAAAKGKISLSSQLPAQAVFVVADANKIFVALDHLIKNAVGFTDAGGMVQVSLKEDGDAVVVEVADSGIGIPAADLPRVFDRFYQVEGHMTRRHGGMGLGLSIARTLVEMHGGSVHAESVEGKGSRFSMHMPRMGWAGQLD
ncbi:MAG: HAMP domain-containing histidine kinase [Anaerolineales bacterium]|nr:HAMP domain-containing histidine kinase [Anaerolineales bacterium]